MKHRHQHAEARVVDSLTVGELRRVLNMHPEQGAGVVELRSPDAWASWAIEHVEQGHTRTRYLQTGPASVAVVPVPVGASVSAEVLATCASANLPTTHANGVSAWDHDGSGTPGQQVPSSGDWDPAPRLEAWWYRGIHLLEHLVEAAARWSWVSTPEGTLLDPDNWSGAPWWHQVAHIPRSDAAFNGDSSTQWLGFTPGTATHVEVTADKPLQICVKRGAGASGTHVRTAAALEHRLRLSPWDQIGVCNTSGDDAALSLAFYRE